MLGRGAGERPLEVDRRVQSGVGAAERGEEAVSLELRHLTVVAGEDLLDEQMMVADQLLPALGSELLRRRARVRDVAEHQRDRAVGRAHPARAPGSPARAPTR